MEPSLRTEAPLPHGKSYAWSNHMFSALSPLDHWVKIDKGRMHLKPKNVCRYRRCTNESSMLEILKWAICASWAESKGLASFGIFFYKCKEHGDSRAPLADLKRELEKYIGKLGTAIVDSSIQFAVNFMFQSLIISDSSSSSQESSHGLKVFPPAPSRDSETGLQV